MSTVFVVWWPALRWRRWRRRRFFLSVFLFTVLWWRSILALILILILLLVLVLVLIFIFVWVFRFTSTAAGTRMWWRRFFVRTGARPMRTGSAGTVLMSIASMRWWMWWWWFRAASMTRRRFFLRLWTFGGSVCFAHHFHCFAMAVRVVICQY